MIIQENMTLMDKLTILSDAAKYDAACTSSGVDRNNNGIGMGNSRACGICHSFAADGRCISLLKILFTNECIYNCRYCMNRASNDVVRATFTPEEVCTLTLQFYRRNYIEGLFLSSGIINSPDYTMQLLCETVILLRSKYHFGGYIHLKGIPGASQNLIELAGWYADRMSVNLELPTGDGLRTLAPSKTRKNILTPMRSIQQGIRRNALVYEEYSKSAASRRSSASSYISGKDADYERMGHNASMLLAGEINESAAKYGISNTDNHTYGGYEPVAQGMQNNISSRFVPAGQSTQMIIGATEETDYQIITVAEALYRQYSLKRVFYSAFVNVNMDSSLPMYEDGPPLLREHRLYQADWLLRYYGFKSEELVNESHPNFNTRLDPKCDWAVHHLEMFPVEINRADYYTLLRVPGIGVKSAKRILAARRNAVLGFDDIKRMGVVLKRALYFITCSGKMMYNIRQDEAYITECLEDTGRRQAFDIEHPQKYVQLSLF